MYTTAYAKRYQSYHTGIETQVGLVRHLAHVAYQSYHTGIETVKWIKGMFGAEDYQSYHTGIETDDANE